MKVGICAAVVALTAALGGSVDALAKEYPASLERLSGASARGDLETVTPLDLGAVPPSNGRVPDLGATPGKAPHWLKPSSKKLLRGAHHWEGMEVKEQQFQDEHGHVVTLATDNPVVDLGPWARRLVSGYHYGEVELVHVFVTSLLSVQDICGETAIACYIPDDPDELFTGVIVISHEDPDSVHTMLHEYGHHMDNQLYNLSRVTDCGYSADGSRRWFFARDMENDILNNTGCSFETPWEYLLGELYAEDYAQLSGLRFEEFDPRLSSPGPTQGQLEALRHDVDAPFIPQVHSFKGKWKKTKRTEYMALDGPSFLDLVSDKGARGITARDCDTLYEDVFEDLCTVRFKRLGRSKKYSVRIEAY
jgi:hypothetical protein